MLKYHYRILKYIHKHEPISKSDILKKFSDFEEHATYISSYILVEDKNTDVEIGIKSRLFNEAREKGLNVSERPSMFNHTCQILASMIILLCILPIYYFKNTLKRIDMIHGYSGFHTS